MILINNLYFAYQKNKPIIEDLSLEFREGEIWGILGHNGAGKTTLFRLLLELLKPESGSISINSKKTIGYLPESNGLYEKLTSFENLKFRGRLISKDKKSIIDRSEEMLIELNMVEKKDEKVAFLSSGMRKRIGLGCALIGYSDVLLLDEPTNGLDPISLDKIKKTVSNYSNDENVILINCHDLSSVQEICTHVCILDEGRLRYSGKVTNESIKEIYFNVLEERGV